MFVPVAYATGQDSYDVLKEMPDRDTTRERQGVRTLILGENPRSDTVCIPKGAVGVVFSTPPSSHHAREEDRSYINSTF
jgi:hypothetical protein